MTSPIQALMLVALIRLLIETEKPLLCAGIYAGLSLFLGLLLGGGLVGVLIGAAVGFGYSFVWFHFLNRSDRSGIWWVVFFAGLAAPLAVHFALSSVHAG